MAERYTMIFADQVTGDHFTVTGIPGAPAFISGTVDVDRARALVGQAVRDLELLEEAS